MSRSLWDVNFAGEKVSPSRVHACAAGLQMLISSVPLPLRGTGRKKTLNLQHLFSRLWPTAHFQAAMYQQCFQ